MKTVKYRLSYAIWARLYQEINLTIKTHERKELMEVNMEWLSAEITSISWK